MKNLIVTISFVFLSTFCYATTSGQVCFSSTKPSDKEVPAILCMSDLGLYNNGDMEWITVYGGNMAGNYLISSSYDGKPQASMILALVEEGPCSYSRSTKIILKLNNDFSSKLSTDSIQVTIEKETYHDSCHSYPENEEITFLKIK